VHRAQPLGRFDEGARGLPTVSDSHYDGRMNTIVEEIREAYARVGIQLDQPAAYGTYYRLLCAGCGRMVGNVGDRLLPGMAAELVERQRDLYAEGLLGCPCGHQKAVSAR
jgi:hypothetical protein